MAEAMPYPDTSEKTKETEVPVTFHLYCKASNAYVILEHKPSPIPMQRSNEVKDHYTVSFKIPKTTSISYGYKVNFYTTTDAFGEQHLYSSIIEQQLPRRVNGEREAVWDFLESDSSILPNSEGLKIHSVYNIVTTTMDNVLPKSQHLVKIAQQHSTVKDFEIEDMLKDTTTELFEAGYTRPEHYLAVLVLLTSWKIFKSESLKNIIQQPHAKMILKSCEGKTKVVVSEEVHENIGTVLLLLTKIAFGSSACFLLMMKYAYPFLNENDYCKLEKFGKGFGTYKKDALDNDLILQIIRLLCERIVAQPRNKEISRRGKYILEKILRALPFNVTQQFAAEILHSLKSKEHQECVRSLEKTICSIVVGKGEECIAKASSFTHLYHIVEHFLTTFKAKLSLSASTHIAKMCSSVNETDQISSHDISSLKHMIFSEVVTLKEERELLKIIADSKNDFSGLLIQLLDLESVKSDTKFGHSMLMKWMKRRTKFAKDKSAIVKNYHFLLKVLHILFVINSTDCKNEINNVMLKLVKKMHADMIIELLTKVEWQDENAENLFMTHVQQAIESSSGISFFNKNNLGTLYDGRPAVFESQERATLAVTLMDHISTVKTSFDVIDTVLQIMEQKKFWRSILTGKGKHLKTLSSSKTYCHVISCLSKLQNTIFSKKFKYNSFAKLYGIISTCDVSMTLCSIFCDENELRRSVSKSIEETNEVEKTLSTIHSLLNNLCDSPIYDVLRDKSFYDIYAIKQYYHDQHKNLCRDKIEVCEVLKCKAWRSAKNMTSSLQSLQKAPQSKAFWKIFAEKQHLVQPDVSQESVVRKQIPKMKDGTKRAQVVVVHSNFDILQCIDSVDNFLTQLKNEILSSYKTFWESLMIRSNVTVCEVYNMFAECDIDTEISIIKEFPKIKFTGKNEVDLKTLFKIKEYKDIVTAIIKALEVFDIDANGKKSLYQTLAVLEANDTKILEQRIFWKISGDVHDLHDVASNISSDMLGIIHLTGTSSTLINFLKRVADEDLRNLIDAVEQYTESLMHVQESTVSSLIEVKRFLYPLLVIQTHEGVTIQRFIDLFKQQLKLGIPFIERKLHECNANIHSLIELYNSKANRGQQTLEIVQSIVEVGTFTFYIQNENVTFKVHTVIPLRQDQFSKEMTDRSQPNANEVTYFENKLRDLLSRSHLLINAKKSGSTDREKDHFEVKKQKLEEFICCINKVLELSNVYSELRSLGHYCYVALDISVKFCELDDLLQQKVLELEDWNSNLTAIRETHYYMNHVHPNYIPALFQFAISKGRQGRNDVLSLLQYIMPNVILPERFNIPLVFDTKTTLQTIANMLGQTLKELSVQPVQTRQFFTQRPQFYHTSLVQKGFFHITQLPEKSSKSSIQAMLKLYLVNSGNLPNANQVVLCTKDTDWIEISLLLRRCSRSLQSASKQNIFCIVNIDDLPLHFQKKLSMEIKSIESNTGYLLASVFCGGDNEAFLNQFLDHVRYVEPLSDYETQQCFKSAWPDVIVVKSTSARLGKTAFIKCEFENIFEKAPSKQLVTLHISGVLNKYSLIQTLIELNITEQTVLHIDVGMIDKPGELDVFLFQLIALRFVSHGRRSYYLQTSTIFIEIANTVNNTLEDSMPIIALFKTKELSWNDYTNFRISDRLTSSVQIVCNYLHSLKMKTIDSNELSFPVDRDATLHPLSEDVCRDILKQYFPTIKGMSFSIVEVFLSVFSEQLQRMTTSDFFKLNTLQNMTSSHVHNIRSSMVEILLDVSRDFALKSVTSYRTIQELSHRRLSDLKKEGKISDIDETESEGVVQWEHSHQSVVVFHQDEHSISVLYKHLEHESTNIRRIRQFVETQNRSDAKSLETRTQVEFQNMLLRMLSRNKSAPYNDEYVLRMSSYALTPDNVLKFMLISLRIQSRMPVVLIGETGCGKTSLIRNLAFLGNVMLEVFNLHAGITELEIINLVINCHKRALENIQDELWLFFDEVNTSEHVGLLASIICNHECQNRPLASNLILIAACNPYTFRKRDVSIVSGLNDGSNAHFDLQSHLVYRVHPLPSSLVNYVWDFGALNEKDEAEYIKRMLQSSKDVIASTLLLDAFTELIAVSQTFVRKNEKTEYSVSLRDVDRCKELVVWFLKYYMQKKDKITDFKDEQFIKAIILSLGVCYLVRFTSEETRKSYFEEISIVFSNRVDADYTVAKIAKIVQDEQNDILNKMELPLGTAKNKSLRENVFVMLVCTLNRFPLFVIGKPGCSKSLALQLLRNNLRGLDSSDDFFKRLPYLFYVSYQGSEQSTSEGIIKVFETARAYQDANKNYQSTDISESKDNDTQTIHQQRITALVVLDEVGLAEKSGANPLKVLHSLLESSGHGRSDVSFIGISNWRLDAAKMNRAIHLSRPDMSFDDLYETGRALHDSMGSSKWQSEPPHLEKFARAYDEYRQKQQKMNFHGLRDYYSLIKFVSREISPEQRLEKQQNIIKMGILRNFSGLGKGIQNAYTIFQKHLEINQLADHDTMTLITGNIKDESCRHLLLVSSNNSTVDSLQRLLSDMDREFVSMIGSCFPQDANEDYGYRILSDIILYMEQGQVLILKNLEKIYGSLYDMLNQNYTTVGKKKHCRIALGPHSNPMCYVNDAFKCIVILDEEQVANSDPPFLNRFEKQIFEMEDRLSEFQQKILTTLQEDVRDMCVTRLPVKDDLYVISPILSKQNLNSTLASIVLTISRESDFTEVHEPVRTKCLQFLLLTMNPESVLNLHHTRFWENNYELGSILQQAYMEKSHHYGLKSFLTENVLNKRCDVTNTTINPSSMYTVLTYSNPLVQIQNNLENINFQIETLSTISSEKHFQERMKHFWMDSESEVLIVRALTRNDFDNFLLSKIITEKWRKLYMDMQCTNSKHVVFIVYLRGHNHLGFSSKMDFLTDCRETILLDTLMSPIQALPQIVNKSVFQVLTERKSWLKDTLETHLHWAFHRIHYLDGSCIDRLERIVNVIRNTPEIRKAFVDIIFSFFEDEDNNENDETWIANIAQNYEAVLSSITFTEAIENYLLEKIRQPLAMLIYHLERVGAFHVFPTLETDEYKLRNWLLLLKKDIFHDISQIPKPTGPGCYYINGSAVESKVPFSKLFFDRIESLKSLYFDSLFSSNSDSEEDDDNTLSDSDDDISESKYEVHQRIVFQISHQTKDLNDILYNEIKKDYMHDFCNYAFTSTLKDMENKTNILHWTMKQFESCREDGPEKPVSQFIADLHMCYWENCLKMDAFFKLLEMSKSFFHDSVYKFWLSIVTESDEGKSCVTDDNKKMSDFVKDLSKALTHKKPLLESNQDNWFIWLQTANAVLVLADTVNENSRETGNLKLYVEIECVLNSHGSTSCEMYILDNECIESETIYERLTLTLKQVLDSNLNLPTLICNKIVSIYLNRCFAVNQESTERFCQLLKDLQRKNIFDMKCIYFGPTFKFYFLEESGKNSSYFRKALFAQTDEDLHKIQKEFGNVAKELNNLLTRQCCDRTLEILMVNIFENHIFNFDKTEIDNLVGSRSEMLKMATNAAKLVTLCHMPVLRLVGISFLKRYLFRVAHCIRKRKPPTKAMTDNLNAVLHYDEQSSISVRYWHLYFLKCIENCEGLVYLKRCCSSLLEIEACKLFHQETMIMENAFELESVSIVGKSLWETNMGEIERISQCKEDTSISDILHGTEKEVKSFLLCFFRSNTFLKHYRLENVSERDRKVAEKIMSLVEDDASLYPKLLSLLCLRSNPEILFRKTTDTDNMMFQILSILSHFICTVFSSTTEEGFWLKCLKCPKEVQEVFKSPEITVKDHAAFRTLSCQCNNRISTDKNYCPICSCKQGIIEEGNIIVQHHSDVAFFCQSGNVSPLTYHILQFFIKGCLMFSKALNYIDNSTLKELLQCHAIHDIDEYLQMKVVCHWKSLCVMLNFGNGEIHNILKIVLTEIPDLVTGLPLQSRTHEESINQHVHNILRERESIILKEEMSHNKNFEIKQESYWYQMTKEVEHGDDTSFLLSKPSLPSIENMYAELLLSGEECTFLKLVLERHDQLKLPQYIPAIIKWHSFIVETSSYHLDKTECELSLGILRSRFLNNDIKKSFDDRFEKFSEVWDLLKSNIQEVKFRETPKLEALSMDSKISQCLLLESNSLMYKIIEMLVRIQNNFLDEALTIAATSSSKSVSFLNKGIGAAVIPITSLMGTTLTNVLNIMEDESENSFLENIMSRFSECCTVEGKGRKIIYNFQKIEFEVAHYLLHGRSYISLHQRIPRVQFRDDVFQNTVGLIADIKHHNPQEDLPKDFRKAFKNKAKTLPLNEILMVTGSVIAHLALTGAEPETPYVKYLEKHKNALPQSSEKEYLSLGNKQVYIKHAVTFYRLMEELHGEKILANLPQTFSAPLPNSVDVFISNISGEKGSQFLEDLLIAMKTFAYRYLSANKETIDKYVPLCTFLRDASYWPEEYSENSLSEYFLQPEFKILHIVSLVNHVTHFINSSRYRSTKKESPGKPRTKGKPKSSSKF